MTWSAVIGFLVVFLAVSCILAGLAALTEQTYSSEYEEGDESE